MMEKRESHRQTLCSSSSSSIGREPKAPAHEFSNPKNAETAMPKEKFSLCIFTFYSQSLL